MEITLKYYSLCEVIWQNLGDISQRAEKIAKLLDTIHCTYGLNITSEGNIKIENFYKSYEKKYEAKMTKTRFKEKYNDWLNTELNVQIGRKTLGRPRKDYEDVQQKTKKKRQEEVLTNFSSNEIKDSFKADLIKIQPKKIKKIVDVLPTASPERLNRMLQSISTPKSSTSFTEEDALALILSLGLSRNKYGILRKALQEKGYDILPNSQSIKETEKKIAPSPIKVDHKSASVELSKLLDKTASRIISNFSKEELEKCHNSELTLICKWGCDGTSGFTEYKQQTASNEEVNYSSMFMTSLVPLRMRLFKDDTSPSNSSTLNKNYEDLWTNLTPGSKFLCRPVSFGYIKETVNSTKDIVEKIKSEISNLSPLYVEINECILKISFQLVLTMIDGKVVNAITDTTSTWKCNICGKKSSEFHEIADETVINEEALKFGISPLHARIRFMEYCLHLAYDIKYRQIPGNVNKSAKNNTELHNMRSEEKKRIQNEFKQKLGLIVDKPLHGYGSSNDGNTARRFFEDPETTSKITGIDENLIKRFKILLAAINSKKRINSDKFHIFANETKSLLSTSYRWRPITPTVHRILSHGKTIIENSILPLGELTEEAQEARNSDVKHYWKFNTRKHSKDAQNSDLMHHLLISSDPIIYSIRTKWLPKICLEDDPEAKEIENMLTFDTSDYFIPNF